MRIPLRLALGLAFVVAFTYGRLGWVYFGNYFQMLAERNRPAPAATTASPAAAPSPHPIESFEVPAYVARFEPMKRHLPPTGEVGYLSIVPPERLTSDLFAAQDFTVSQYALVPRLLVNDPHREWVVANAGWFRKDPPPLPPGYELVEDYGQGLALYRRRP